MSNLETLENIKSVEPPEGLYNKIEKKIGYKNLVPRTWLRAAAACAVFLISVESGLAVRYFNTASEAHHPDFSVYYNSNSFYYE